MALTTFDWVIVLVTLVIAFVPAAAYARRGGSSTSEFFTSGRAAPWWLIGASMVATTFSTDTPNLVTNLVREGSIANNWVWWAFLLTGMTTVFFYARLWRRLGILTDLEFYELRYSGRAASWVRGFRAIYLGLLFNIVIMAAVNLAAAKIANVLLGWPVERTLVVCTVMSILFAATAGLWGVLVSDMLQFGIAMVGSVATAVYALGRPEVGGLGGLVERIDPARLSFLPDFSDWSSALAIFVIPLTVQWWSTWYPGSEPGGGSYIAQRMLAARSERDAMAGTLFFNIAHYALRPWPWILVALCSLLVFPDLASIARSFPHVDSALLGHDMAYPAMLTFLPAGLLGLAVAGLTAAYISTISTHLNWGTSYLVHDFYRRFMKPGASEAHYVWAGRLVTVVLMILAAFFTLTLETAREVFDLLLAIGAGTGLLYLLRWFWWRINAWSEIVAMATSFLLALALFLARRAGYELPAHHALLLTIAITTAAWLAATWFGPPTDRRTLISFYKLARPAGPGWREIRSEAGNLPPGDELRSAFVGTLAGCVLVYGALFGSGHLLIGNTTWAALFLAVTIGSAVVLRGAIKRSWAR